VGISGYPVATEFLDNELQWSTFESREAQSKIRYFGRISVMPQNRWPRAILTMMETLDCKTVTYGRMDELKRLYRCQNIRINTGLGGRHRLNKFNQEVETMVSKTSLERRQEGMLTKRSLATYRMHDQAKVKTSCIYSNDRGSALLSLARAGMLPTRTHRRHFEPGFMTYCVKCGTEPETVEHVVLECNTALQGEQVLLQRLGLTQGINHAAIRETKRILMSWESETRDIR